ncbi:MAG: monovalent cation/H(+) antiporter subunit G [Gammaproteobacteria bacterium]|nr:monovalent cation/H(+) antiporter subunit G [Gammaproteobacteria bacterium]
MDTVSNIIGNLSLIIGSLFLFSAGLGVLRMPDTYNRIQAGTKATTLGTILVLIGLAFLHPAWSLKLILLIFFVLLTNPVSSHALARASHAIGIHETEATVVDQLDTDRIDELADNAAAIEAQVAREPSR